MFFSKGDGHFVKIIVLKMFFQQLRFGGVAFYEADFTIKFFWGFQCFVAKKLVVKT